MIVRQEKREKLVEKYAKKIADLKAAGDYEGLSKIPRNAFKTRLHNRCSLTGRPRGYYRKFGLGRLKLRDLALAGLIPGVTKASW